MHGRLGMHNVGHYDVVGMLWCWCVGWDREGDADHQSEVVALVFGVRAYCHTCIVWLACMYIS